jgi:membrane-bound ClpP family serine protease
MNKHTTDVREGIGGASKDASRYYGQPKEFQISYTPMRAGIFNIYLFGEIECAEQFIPSIEVLSAAGENDVVIIHLQTPGGSLEATDTFISAMRDCDARIIVRARALHGTCHAYNVC